MVLLESSHSTWSQTTRMVIHVHIRSSYFWEQSYSLSIVHAPMVSEHNVGQPVEAIGVMDRVEVV